MPAHNVPNEILSNQYIKFLIIAAASWCTARQSSVRSEWPWPVADGTVRHMTADLCCAVGTGCDLAPSVIPTKRHGRALWGQHGIFLEPNYCPYNHVLGSRYKRAHGDKVSRRARPLLRIFGLRSYYSTRYVLEFCILKILYYLQCDTSTILFFTDILLVN